MLKTIKRILMSLSVSTLLLTPALATGAVHAQTIQDSVQCGVSLDASAIDSDPNCAKVEGGDASDKVDEVVRLVINIFSWIVGIISVIMIIVGGLKYITSSGDSGNVGSAKNTILYAVVGLVIVALAQFIVQFVLDKVID